MIAHYGCLEDVSAVIDVCPLVLCHLLSVLAFEVDHPFGGQSVF